VNDAALIDPDEALSGACGRCHPQLDAGAYSQADPEQ
jgi:hypothetical protein